MQALLDGELAVVIHDRVQRHMSVRHVMREDRCIEHDVVEGVAWRRLPLERRELALQAAVKFRRSPWQRALLGDHRLAEFLNGRIVVARQPVKGYGPNASKSKSRK